jgi:hypothetical protein
METTRIEHRAGVRATSDRIWEVLSDLPQWDRWNPYERGVGGAIAFGGSITLTETLPGMAERRVEARVGDWQPGARLVWVDKRGFLFRVIRLFEIEELEPGSCIVTSGTLFEGLRGELFHDKHKKAIKAAHGVIAEGLKLAAET